MLHVFQDATHATQAYGAIHIPPVSQFDVSCET
jgi:hypothetical protein